MDTNLKDDMDVEEEKVINDSIKRNWFTSSTLGIFLMILILTVVSVGIYTPVKNYLYYNNDIESYIESNDFAYTLASLTRYLNQTKLQNMKSYNKGYDNLQNIKYYIKSEKTNTVVSNIPELEKNTLQEEINNSQFYLHVTTDEKGNPSIASVRATRFNGDAFINWLKDTNQKEKDEFADLEIHYIIPKKLSSSNDLLTYNMKNSNIKQYIILILIIGGISILILTIIAFAIPYSMQKEATIVKFFNNMYLEFKFLCWIVFMLSCSFIYHNGSYNSVFNLTEIIYDANWYFYLIGIPVTFVLCSLIYLSIVYMKYIYHKGFVEGFIKNSIGGKLFFYIVHSIKKTIDNIIDIDITKEYHKKLLYILAVNFAALCVIALTGGLGLVLAFAYTIFLFNYLIRILDKTRALNKASSQLSKGNFDIVLPEEGILSPFAKNLNSIKDGFRIAVEEEVKSQNMKTELITNVSHDLKTPLTSIITYVDLLKNEDIDEKTRKEYIDILDNKSKRLKVLIDDLFEASKASSGNIELHLEEVDVIALFRQTLGELEEKISESTLQMKLNLPENKVICELDGRRTYRVFENIISNILKYSMKDTRVYIDVEENEKEVQFIFKNISSYEMNFDSSEIMERFTRGDKSRSSEGSGLGLAIAKSLVELQKGSLAIAVDGDLFKLIVTFPRLILADQNIDV